MKHYAVHIIGCGKRKRYALVSVHEFGTNPVTGGSYATLADAMDAARALGIEIERVGDFWQIIG